MELLGKIFLLFTCLYFFSFGCTKDDGIIENKEANRLYARSTAFPTVIFLGPDATYPRTDSVFISSAYAYLNSCGTAPETEAPHMGSEVYQLSGPTQAKITWPGSTLTLTNLSPGNYVFAGRAWVEGFRTCDSSYINQQSFDTLYITVLKSRKKK